MQRLSIFLIAVLYACTSFAQNKSGKQDEEELNIDEKCNCNANQFQRKYAEKFVDDKYITDFLLDFNAQGENRDSISNVMKEKLTVSLAKKIRSKVTSVETHTISENTTNNVTNAQDNYVSTSKSESNVDLSGTYFRICPDKKQENIYHGFVYIKKAQFLTAQLSMYKLILNELQTQVNLITKNLMDYNLKDLSKEYSNCLKKKDKADQIAFIYSSVSSNNEITDNAEIKKINETLVPKLAQIRKRLYNKDVDKRVDSARFYIDAKRYPEAMANIDQILKVNPDHEQMRELQGKCSKLWADEAPGKIEDYVKNKKFEEALAYVNQAIYYKVSENAMNQQLGTLNQYYFDDCASKVQAKIDAKDVVNAKKLMKKLQPLSKLNPQKYDELSKAVAKIDW